MKIAYKRLTEPSTWAAIASLCLVFGLTDEQAQTIGACGATIASLVAVFVGERTHN